MLVTVRLFARLREICGAAELPLEVNDSATIGDVWTALARRYPGIGAYAGSVSCAVNEEYAREGARVREGDEVAFLPPVSGG